MNLLVRLLALCGVLLTLTACMEVARIVEDPTSTTDAPDPDALTLAALSEQAIQIAQTEAPEVALRQVFTDLNATTFLFTDRAATMVIYIHHVPGSDVATDQWGIQVDTISQHIGHPAPGIDLQTLRIGPGRVAQAIQEHWQGCELKSLTLYEEDNTLVWRVFCETPQGWVAGNFDQVDGVFQPDEAGPMQPPAVGEFNEGRERQKR